MIKKNPKRNKAARSSNQTAKLKAKFAHIENGVFRRALIAAKGYTQLAEALEVSRQSVHKWDAVPDRFAVKLEELYGIPRYETAPHLYEGMTPATADA